MLIIHRSARQKIHVGDDIRVEVRKIKGNRVSVSIEAPKSTKIRRGELRKREDK